MDRAKHGDFAALEKDIWARPDVVQGYAREFTLAAPLSEGAGNLSIDDTIWRITGPDMPAGTKVRVEAIDGARLVVSRVS